jgi:hypothetical protein
VRLLLLNTTLLIFAGHDYINHEDRAEVFGTVAGSHGYDVAAFCEVFKRGHARTLADAYDQASQKSTRWAHHQDPRLLTAIGLESGDSDGVRRIPTAGWAPFFHQWAEDGYFQGFQRRTLDTSRSQGVHGVDLFTTHLQPNSREIGSNEGALEMKGDQLRNLATWIVLAQEVFDDPIEILRGRYGDEYLNFLEKFWEGPDRDRDLIDHPLFDQRPEAPTTVVGDFNFASDQDYGSVDANVYDLEVLTDQFSRLGLQDAWTTHGGPAGGTIGVDVTRRDDKGVEGIHDGKPYPGGVTPPRRRATRSSSSRTTATRTCTNRTGSTTCSSRNPSRHTTSPSTSAGCGGCRSRWTVPGSTTTSGHTRAARTGSSTTLDSEWNCW